MGHDIFTNWQKERKQILPNHDVFMYKDIMQMIDEEINRAMSFFVAEVRNKSGDDYRSNSLYEIVCAIQHKMRHDGRFTNFLDDDRFYEMRSILDYADIITETQEEEMWSKGFFFRKRHTPETSRHIIFSTRTTFRTES